jgi:hypothetical protein
VPESSIVSLHRKIAGCGCAHEGPGETCSSGKQLFELVRQAHTQVCGAHPCEHIPWTIYETQRARYYAHLGEVTNYLDMMSSYASFSPDRGAFLNRLGATNVVLPLPTQSDVVARIRLAFQQLEPLVEQVGVIATAVNQLYLDVPRDHSPLDHLVTFARLRCFYAVQRIDEASKYLAFVLKEVSTRPQAGQE